MISKLDKNAKRKARHYRTRRHIIGTPARPRLNVYRSLNHIYAQVIDDSIGNTIAAASTVEASVKALIEGKNKKEAAFIVGETVAKRLSLHRSRCRAGSRCPQGRLGFLMEVYYAKQA